MKKANSTNFFHVRGWLMAFAIIILTGLQVSAQCTLVCNNLVQVSLDNDCSSEVLPDMVLEGGGCPNGVLQVQAKVNNVWVPANGNFVATSANINQTLQVRVRDLVSGNFCTGYIHIEDKLAPVLACSNINLSCAITTYDPDYLLNTLNITEAYPDVEDNCGSYTLTYLDTWFDLTCNGTINGLSDISAYVKRVWTAVDQSGNQASCTQYIYFQRKHVTQVIFPADITVSCEDPITTPAATGAPYVTDFDLQFPIYPSNGFCELNATYSDQILPICDGTYKILRTWTVYDWCLPTSPTPPFTNPMYYIQLIKVNDDQGPEAECPEDITVGTNPWDCQRDLNLPDVVVTDNCSRLASIKAVWSVDGVGHELNGSFSNFPGNNLWAPDTLGVLGVANDLPIGVTQMTYIITDNCGNSSVCTFDITVEDDTPPTAACDSHTQVSLGSSGEVLVNASTFDDGSYDNCSPVYFKARRMDDNDCQTNTKFHDQVKFCCEDVGDTITIVFRVYDVPVVSGPVDLDYEEWHSNDCMVQVYVDDKLKPTCTSPANVTVSCEAFDPSLWAYGMATATDNCCIDTITVSNNYNLFDTVCNKGTITRTFRAFDCGGLSSQCTQRIIVNYEQDYFVKFPNDVIVTACDGTGNYGEPSFFGKDCELLGVSFEDQVFTVVPDACFKIERTWTIINWCTYNPNADCVIIPNPNPNPNTNSPQNLPGPIVSACGTPAPWNPTVISIAPGQPQTNYCLYYNPNANCYQYKQIIKIIDTQKPTINCPASPVEFCDITANNPQLWNESYWFDSVHGLHDLCEGPANLTVTATDACSGANVNISFLLFLDLDGDGNMETVLNSNDLPTTPGTVNFGNAGNPGYTGGTPSIFDERPVLPDQKYRFALHQSVTGNTRTAAVQWKTLSQMPTPNNPFGSAGVVPELPYGTHKIKWLVTDGCGNEQFCEYTFVVKDCKAPTVVCHDGLSVNIMPNQMIQMWAADFLQYAEDNCTPPTATVPGPNQLVFAIRKAGQGTGFPVDALGNPITNVIFDCSELGSNEVELWAQDMAGNADFCLATLDVQDNLGSCSPGAPAIAGFLKTEMTEGLEDANVNLQGTGPVGQTINLSDATDNDGLYLFPSGQVPVGSDFTITPLKDDNPLNGVSTFDIVQINKHILGLTPLNTPYKMIAADANKSNSITTFDVVEIRKLILGIYPKFPNNTSWRFVNKSFIFSDPKNPFTSQFPETVSIYNMQFGLSDEFVSIKIGDVNNTAIANAFMLADDRSANTLYFDLEDRSVQAGEDFVVHFKAAENAAAYQFTLNTGDLEVLEVIPGEKMAADNFAVFQRSPDGTPGAITASVDDNAGMFSVRFRAHKAGELSKMLGFSNRITRTEAYNESGDRLEPALRFNGASGPVVAGTGFELLQNTPNPMRSSTNITFNLPEACEATLSISNAEGRILKVVKGDFSRGLNTVTLQRSDLEAGILFYQLDTPANSAVKKMIVVD